MHVASIASHIIWLISMFLCRWRRSAKRWGFHFIFWGATRRRRFLSSCSSTKLDVLSLTTLQFVLRENGAMVSSSLFLSLLFCRSRAPPPPSAFLSFSPFSFSFYLSRFPSLFLSPPACFLSTIWYVCTPFLFLCVSLTHIHTHTHEQGLQRSWTPYLYSR